MVQRKFVSAFTACIFILGASSVTFAETKSSAKKAALKKASKPIGPVKAKITTLQEGWYKVTVGGIQAGYSVQRVEFNSTTKQFVATSYLRTSAVGGNINESLKSYASEILAPLSYQYTSLTDKGGKTIDATFKGSVASLVITEGGQVKTEQVKFKDGSLLSSMLIYTILRSKEGVKVGNNYGYVAVAEEDGRACNGSAFIQEQTTVNGQAAYKILNKFRVKEKSECDKEQQFIAYVTPTGKVLETRFPEDNIDMKLSNREDAVGNLPINDKTLALLFGEVPLAGASSDTAISGTPTITPQADPEGVPNGLSVPPGKGKPLGPLPEKKLPTENQ